MKIRTLNVHTYLQFNDFNLDLTYPKGHQKEGLPLDKVCFIGQSGTGKTSLLRLVKAFVSQGFIGKHLLSPVMKKIKAQLFCSDTLTFEKPDRYFKIENGKIEQLGTSFLQKDLTKYYDNANVFVSFPAEMNVDLPSIFREKKQKGGFSTETNEKITPSVLDVKKLDLKYFDFEQNNIEAVWNLILDDIQKYKIAQLSYTNELTNKLNNGAIKAGTLLHDFQNWKSSNPNPLEDLAAKLNPLLNRFNLEIKPEFDFKSADDLRFIQILQKDSNREIPNGFWSTGTKQLIMTAIPLLKLNTDKTIIMIDEPERSFYPDIQRDLMGFYQHLAPNAQFFIATHSPIIAASFDPWEIIELKFDEKGNVVQESYYEGERHIDNFKIHPKYLRWDAVLTRLFDLKQDGMPERQTKLEELAELDVKLRRMKKANGSANPAEAKMGFAPIPKCNYAPLSI